LGTYLCESASADTVVFRHEGEDDHSIEIHAGAAGASGFGAFAPVPQVWFDRATVGKRYFVSLALTEAAEPTPAPVAEPAPVPAWAVQPEPERTVPSATEPGQVDQLAPSNQEAQDGVEGSPADTESDGESEAASNAPVPPGEAE
jgi:hypothetical protein